MKEMVCRIASLAQRLEATEERGIITNLCSALLRRAEEDNKLHQRIIQSLSWMVETLRWSYDCEKNNLEPGSQGGYSLELQEAIDLLNDLENDWKC